MGSEIQVGGGPIHNRIEVETIANVDQAWRNIKHELAHGGEHGVNNNQLKELFRIFASHAQYLHAQVEALPAQGRNVVFTGSSIMFSQETMNKIIASERQVRHR